MGDDNRGPGLWHFILWDSLGKAAGHGAAGCLPALLCCGLAIAGYEIYRGIKNNVQYVINDIRAQRQGRIDTAVAKRVFDEETRNAYKEGTARINEDGKLLILRGSGWEAAKGYDDCARRGRPWGVPKRGGTILLLEFGEAAVVNTGHAVYSCLFTNKSGRQEARTIVIAKHRESKACASGQIDICDQLTPYDSRKTAPYDGRATLASSTPLMQAPFKDAPQFLSLSPGTEVRVRTLFTMAPEDSWAEVDFAFGGSHNDSQGRPVSMGFLRRDALSFLGPR